MNREEKEATVAELRERLEGAEAAILTEYRGLTVTQANQLRRAISQEDAVYRVVKNSLARLAVEGTRFAGLKDEFVGPISVTLAYADPTGTVKALTRFAEANPVLVIRKASLGERLLSPEEVKALSKLPGRQELLAQLVGALAGPLRNLVGVLSGVPRSCVQVLNAIRENKAA